MSELTKASVVSGYIPIPSSRQKEFWHAGKIQHIRTLSQTGRAVRTWTQPEELCSRPLDRLRFKGVDLDGRSNKTLPVSPSDVDTSVELAYGRIELSSPLYLGDMSYGALSGIANIALARAADMTGVLAGTGEGGLQSEVRQCKRITVQWASARFGVDMDVLNSGLAIVIKIGQGAKPGIGGHLPGTKVTEPISQTRRLPPWRDAISPSPHHDIYSIEDLGQRILALKEATGKPVFVKVGATNYVPYIASGVARMGGDGIILDASGAGTGAAPSVVKDNVGLPIEVAVASVDQILRKENLRDGFSIVAAGRVSNSEDTAKLIALGADCCSIGTACLMSMGCLMVHKCHIGFCPALLTNKTTAKPVRILSLEKATEWTVNLIKGWSEELRLILEEIGLKRIRELVGRRDLLQAFNTNEETRVILGVGEAEGSRGILPAICEAGEFWSELWKKRLQEMAGTVGRAGGEAVISSMGSVGPPFVDAPRRIADRIVSDGAQVTRPSIDPYRERIETACYLGGGMIRLSFPVFFAPLRNPFSSQLAKVFARVANSMGLLLDLGETALTCDLEKYAGRILTPALCITTTAAGYSVSEDGLEEARFEGRRPRYLRIGCSESSVRSALKASALGFDGIILDDYLDDNPSPVELEVAISEVDRALRKESVGRSPLRNHFDILIAGSRIRSSEDVFKMCGLGANAVGISSAALLSIGLGDSPARFDEELARDRLENLVFAMQKEIKLLAGAAGVSNLYTSLIGNRELFRTLDLEPQIRKRLGVKPAGVG